MSLRKNLVIVSCFVVAVFGVLQVQANAALVASWGLDETPALYLVSTSVAGPHGTGTGTVCTDSSGNGNNLMYGSASTPGTQAFTSVTLSGVGVPSVLQGDTALTNNGNGIALSWLNHASGIGATGQGLVYPGGATGSTGSTIEFWFNPATTLSSGAAQYIYTEDRESDFTPVVGVYILNPGSGYSLTLSTNCRAAGGFLGNVNVPHQLSTNTWYFGALEEVAGGGYTAYLYDYGTSTLYNSLTVSGLGSIYAAPIDAELFTTSCNYGGDPSKFQGTMDNVRIYNSPLGTQQLIADATGTVTPEPGTLALLAAGLAGLLCYAWRKRR